MARPKLRNQNSPMHGHGKIPQALSLYENDQPIAKQYVMEAGSLGAYYSVNMVLDVIWKDFGVLLKKSACIQSQLIRKKVMIPWPRDASCALRHWTIEHVGHFPV